MNLTIPQPALAATLAKASRALATKTHLPVLTNFLLDAKDGVLTVAATNLELTIVATASATIAEPGTLTVPGKLLLDVVSSHKADATITLAAPKLTLTVLTDGGSTSQMRGIDAEEFPRLQSLANGTALVVEPAKLRDALSKTIYAAATDASRPVLNAVNLRLQGDHLDVAAADGWRMALTTVELLTVPSGELSVNVPLKTAQELVKLLDGEDSPIQILASDNLVRVALTDLTVTSSVIVGTYPTIRQLVPAEFALSATMARRGFESAVRVARFFCERDQQPAVKMLIGEHGIDVSSIGDTGQTEDLVPAEITGDGFRVGYNVFYLADALNAISSERVTFRGNSPNTPGILVGDQDPAVHLMMPMHLKGEG